MGHGAYVVRDQAEEGRVLISRWIAWDNAMLTADRRRKGVTCLTPGELRCLTRG